MFEFRFVFKLRKFECLHCNINTKLYRKRIRNITNYILSYKSRTIFIIASILCTAFDHLILIGSRCDSVTDLQKL